MNELQDTRTLGERIADTVASFGGSWRFVIIFASILVTWVTLNALQVTHVIHWDPYPFILLNLFLSFIAAFQAPIIMMSQNRQAAVDRLKQDRGFEVSNMTKYEMDDVQGHLHRLEDSVSVMMMRVHNQPSIFHMQTGEHIVDHTLEEHIWYPEHEPRSESPEFRKNKEYFHKIDAPCYICGTRSSEGAEIEIHHLLEWAFWNGMDHEAIARDYGAESPDDIHLLMPLCKKHHRGRFTGVHSVTYPVWIAQKYAADGLSFTEHETFKTHALLPAKTSEEVQPT